MRLLMFTVFAVGVVVAVNAASAMAAPEFLDNVAGNFGKGTISAGTLETTGKVPITCTGGTALLTILSATHLDADLHFKGCAALGAAANSLGDSAGIILVQGLGLLCIIKQTPTLEIGIFNEITPVHIEIPLVGVLINVEGTVVSKVSTGLNSLKTGAYGVEFKQTGGKAAFQCEGKTALLLSSKDAAHTKTEESGLLGSTADLTFVNDLLIDG